MAKGTPWEKQELYRFDLGTRTPGTPGRAKPSARKRWTTMETIEAIQEPDRLKRASMRRRMAMMMAGMSTKRKKRLSAERRKRLWKAMGKK